MALRHKVVASIRRAIVVPNFLSLMMLLLFVYLRIRR
jgi:hypothetical protein